MNCYYLYNLLLSNSLIIVYIYIACAIFLLLYVCYRLFKKNFLNKKETNEYLKYSFIDNSILLKKNKIEKNGFCEVWRQQNDEYSIQILCFNEKTGEFQAFDRFHWMNEPIYDGFTCGDDYKEDLWTPIKLHYTTEWLKMQLQKRIWKEIHRSRVKGENRRCSKRHT